MALQDLGYCCGLNRGWGCETKARDCGEYILRKQERCPSRYVGLGRFCYVSKDPIRYVRFQTLLHGLSIAIESSCFHVSSVIQDLRTCIVCILAVVYARPLVPTIVMCILC